MDTHETDENHHREHGARDNVKSAKALDPVSNQQVERHADGQLRNRPKGSDGAANHDRERAPDEEGGDPGQQGRRPELGVSQSEVKRRTKQSKREEDVKKWDRPQPRERLLRPRIDENDKEEDSREGHHGTVTAGQRPPVLAVARMPDRVQRAQRNPKGWLASPVLYQSREDARCHMGSLA